MESSSTVVKSASLSRESSSLEQIPLEKIILKPEKFRHYQLDLEGVDRLTDDIQKKGMLVPVLLWRQNKDYILISGHHRFASAQKLKWQKIPAQILSFSSEDEAVEASIQTNAQDEYTFSTRDWFSRFMVAENTLRQVYQKKAQEQQKKGKKAKEKIRVDEQLARGVGLHWSYVKYGQIRKTWQKMNELEIPHSVQKCFQKQDSPKAQHWLDVLELHHKGKIHSESWQKFVEVCEKATLAKNLHHLVPVDKALKKLKRESSRPKQDIEPENPSIKAKELQGTLDIWWRDTEGKKVLEKIKKLCREMGWEMKVSRQEGKNPMQTITFSSQKEEKI